MPTQYLFLHFPSSNLAPPRLPVFNSATSSSCPSVACRDPILRLPFSSCCLSLHFSPSSLRWRRGPLVASSRPQSWFYSNGIWDVPRKKTTPPALPRVPPPLPRVCFDSGFVLPTARLRGRRIFTVSLPPTLGRAEPSYPLASRPASPKMDGGQTSGSSSAGNSSDFVSRVPSLCGLSLR